jgi:hypothetical protein
MKTLNIANKDGFRFGEQAYLIGNEYGLKCVSYARNEQDALDYAVDEGFMESEIMSDKDHEEYSSNGWDDSFAYAGNAGEPIWIEYLWIKPASDRKQ